MPKTLFAKAVYFVLKGLAKFEKLSDAALFIQEELNKFDGPTYHVMIAQDFGCSFTTKVYKSVCMKVGIYSVVVFKTGWFVNIPGPVLKIQVALLL